MAVCRKVYFLAVVDCYWLTLLLSMEPSVKGETGPRGLLWFLLLVSVCGSPVWWKDGERPAVVDWVFSMKDCVLGVVLFLSVLVKLLPTS
jgi:hypothetical protein